MDMPYIISIQVGKPKVSWVKTIANITNSSLLRMAGAFRRILLKTPIMMYVPWSTGFYKKPVEGKVWLGKWNLSGDGQADLKSHGVPEKAVLAYSAEHYPVWCSEISCLALPYGAFGENFTVAGLTEKTVCIGDTYTVGEARLQVSQPRQPCWKISRRWRIRDLAERVKITGRTGWYFRVITEGYVECGLPVVLLDRPFPRWTVAHANEIMKHRRKDRHAAEELASCELLSVNWRKILSAKHP